MDVLTRSRLLAHLAAWRATWSLPRTGRRFGVPGNPRFMSAREAVALVEDGSVVMTSGLGGNARASIVYAAIRESFERTGHPRDLTFVAAGGTGARGKAPGTLEDVALEGLCTRFFAGHLETYRAILRLADAGKLELQCLPQGAIALLVDAQARGRTSISARVGVGTFMDPRVGRGSPVVDAKAPQYVAAHGRGLRYSLPPVNVAVFNVPAADRDGNLYATNASLLAEAREAARAARRNGGVVIANVGVMVERERGKAFLPASDVDAIVHHPDTEQTVSVPHRHHWAMLTARSDVPIAEGAARLRFLNGVMRVTPHRRAIDDALARLAASALVAHGRPGMEVAVGVGLPEEVARAVHEAGLGERVVLFTEGGVIGGLPAPGVFFGAAISPRRLVSSAALFQRCRQPIDAAVLGFLEVDGAGNVNSSRRGPGAAGCVGPGGSMELASAARTILFVGSWTAPSRTVLRRGRVAVARGGSPKFVERVGEITFRGDDALRAGKAVLYCTDVGAFRLTRRGMEITCLLPGVDLRRDVLERSPMRIVLPASGEVPVVDEAVVTGRGFALRLPIVHRGKRRSR